MAAWKHMNPLDVDNLKLRNMREYGRVEGPSFDLLVEREKTANSDMNMEQIYMALQKKALESTAAEYDVVYGLKDIAMRVCPKEGVEGMDSLKERQAIIAEAQKQFAIENEKLHHELNQEKTKLQEARKQPKNTLEAIEKTKAIKNDVNKMRAEINTRIANNEDVVDQNELTSDISPSIKQ